MAAGGTDVAVVGEGVTPVAAFDILRNYARDDGPLFLFVWKGAELVDKVLALELGAADVVDAATSTRELAARIGGMAARKVV